MAFDKSAEAKPMVAYVGILEGLGDPKQSQRSEFSVIEYKIKGTHGSRGTKGYLTYLPEFFKPGFKVSSIGANYGKRAKAVGFVYNSNVYTDGAIATLDAFCGSEENLDALSDEAAQLTEFTTESIGDLLKAFFRQLGPVEFGYIVKQQREKREDGSKVRTRFEEIDSYFRAEEKAVARVVKRAASKSQWLADQVAAGKDVSNADELLIGFDTEDFGVETEAEQPSWVNS